MSTTTPFHDLSELSAEQLLDRLSSLEVEVWADGERLRYRAPRGRLADGLRELVAGRRDELLAHIRERDGTPGSAAIPWVVPDPANRYEPFPLTDLQEAYWVGRTDAYELGNVAPHFYLEADLPGLDLERLNRSLVALVRRHDMLRAVVETHGEQRILSEVPPYRIEVQDLDGRPADEVAAGLDETRSRMSHQVFSPARWPLFEIRASRFDGGRVRLHMSFDLLIGDVWSFQIFFRELFRLYHEPETELPPLELSFRDWVLAELDFRSSERFRESRDYWFRRLPSLPPAPALPLAVSPAELERPRFVRWSGRLEADAWRRLKERAGRAGLTPAGALLAAFSEVLGAWSRSRRFTLNLTFFNRLPVHPQVNDIMGDFSATLLLAVEGEGETFEERAKGLQEQLWRDIEHVHLSGVRVLRELARVRRDPAAAAMPVVFTSALHASRSAPEGADEEPWRPIYGISQTPQVWLDHRVTEQAGELTFSWDVVADLFPPGVMASMFAAYTGLLERLASDPGPWAAPVLDLVPEDDLRRIAGANATAAPVPEGLLHGGFLDQAALEPERPAVVAGALTLSYGELARRARRLGGRLRELGARPDRLVGVVMEKGWEQVVAVLGVLESGAAYLPIDAALPRERIARLLELGEVSIAVTQPRWVTALEWPEGLHRLVVEPVDEGEAPELEAVQAPEDLAYVIFTSGSTGVPKGVVIDHRGALNTVADVNRRFEVGPEDRVLALSALSFDLSVYDLFGTLTAGGTMVMPEAWATREPDRWAELLEVAGVTVWNSVPALLEMLVEHLEGRGEPPPGRLRLVLLSGDWIPLSLPDRARRLWPEARVVSLGGATEASIWSILHPVEEVAPGWKSVPYGRAMLNQTFHVLDERLEPRPTWVPGDLYIGGVGLARGYWRDEERTAASFIVHPRTGERLYRTGDLGRWLPSGEIEFLGREDLQVKVQGHRVELGEIEAVLTRHPSVRACVVNAVGDPRGHRRLAAYVVADGAAPAAEELREFLRARLPGYMVPASFRFLDALPLTANGKVDRKALPAQAPVAAAGALRRSEGSLGAVEEILLGIFSEVLGVEGLGAEASFFDHGGHSLLVTRAVSRIRASLAVDLPVRELFLHPTAAALAPVVAGLRWPSDAFRALPLEAEPGREEAPLSFAQQRLWFLDQLEGGSPFYNIILSIRLVGEVRPVLLHAALSEVQRRHAVLRTVFEVRDGRPEQGIRRRTAVALAVVDLGSSSVAEGEREVRRLLVMEQARVFDLTRGPLVRTLVARLGEREHVVVLNVHHIVADGWSVQLLFDEIAAAYDARLRGGLESPLAAPPIQYGDFATWQRRWLTEAGLAPELAYWQQALAGVPPVLSLATDHPRPAVQSHRGRHEGFEIERKRMEALRRLCRREGATLFMGVLALFGVLLRHLGGGDDLVVGTPVSERDRVETEGLIGCFVNLIPLRLALGGDPTFTELLARVRERALEAYSHSQVPFEWLVERLGLARDPSYSPLVQAALHVESLAPGRQGFAELEVEPFEHESTTTHYDVNLTLTETAAVFRGALYYRRDLFERASIRRWIVQLQALLDRVVCEPEARLGALDREIERAADEARSAAGLAARQARLESFRQRRRRAVPAPSRVAAAGRDSGGRRELP